MRYRITTLGCRVNHAESRELESVLLARGLNRAAPHEAADIEVVHTCSVTNTAAAKSRHAIRRATRRLNSSEWPEIVDRHMPLHESGESGGPRRPQPHVIVTGCFGATDPEDASQLAGGPQQVLPPDPVSPMANDPASGPSSSPALAERFARRVDQWLGVRRTQRSLRIPDSGSCPQTIRPLPVVTPHQGTTGHVRAELKVQDGCDAHCSFCIIPKIRRTLRSKTVRDTVAEARRLVDLGHREIVLTGIFLGAYGHETAGTMALSP